MSFVLLNNVITQPVAQGVRTYTAEFTDTSGLYPGADVRVRGVRVGKVQSVELERHDGQSVSAVGFTLERRYAVVSTSRLAIKYQSLTGSRYVDVIDAKDYSTENVIVQRIPTSMTQPSFDITALFNGLQPMLATLNPDEINKFTATAVDFLTGDGEGLAPMLESIRTLSRFVSDRQRVVSTLMSNLATVAGSMRGHSQDMIRAIDSANKLLDTALSVIDEFRQTDLFSTGFLEPLQRLVTNIGFPAQGNNGINYITDPPGRINPNVSNIDEAMDRAIVNIDDFIDAIKLVPVMWENVEPPAGRPVPCSHGRFQLPEQMDVLLNGQRVVLCNR
nr:MULTISPECIES: MlaD family protein [unclassified Mycolicibacterium]